MYFCYMKKSIFLKITLIMLLVVGIKISYAQTDTTKTAKIWVITTNDGGEFVGEIKYQDAKEILIITKDRGEISIPKYQVKEMKEVTENETNRNGGYIPEEIFSTRYFITTNGLPIKKGENYILWSLAGPDFEFGVAKNFSVGVITSWFAYPIIGNIKYSFPVQKKLSIGTGLLIGTSTWGSGNLFFASAIPYASITHGDRKSNITFSLGMSAFYFNDKTNNRVLASVSGMNKVGKKVSLVFDSFIILPSNNTGYSALLIPGIRMQTNADRAFQFGFAGILADNEAVPLPIPLVQWFKKI